MRLEAVTGKRQGVGDAHHALSGMESRLEHVRARQVAALHHVGSASRIAANVLGESRSGRQSQSIEPSRATSAAVRPSPMIA